jgi:hypothetical protein
MRFSTLAALGFTAFLGILTIDAPDANALVRRTAVVSGPRGTAVVSRSRRTAVVSRPRGAVVVGRRRSVTRF